MSRILDDRWLWLGFGAFMFCAVKGIQYAFDDIADLTVLEPLEDNDEINGDNGPENSIDFDTLRILADSPNYNISHSAISIVIERVLNECVFDDDGGMLAEDLVSSDPEVRRKARQAQDFILDYAQSVGHWPKHAWNRPESGHFGINSDDGRSMPASLPELIDARNESGELVQVGVARLDGWVTVPQEDLRNLNERGHLSSSGDEGISNRRRRRNAVVINPSEDPVEDDIIRF